MLMLRHDKLLDDLPGHSHVESPDFFSGGNDLVGGQDEPIVARVPQLHSITEGDKEVYSYKDKENVFMTTCMESQLLRGSSRECLH